MNYELTEEALISFENLYRIVSNIKAEKEVLTLTSEEKGALVRYANYNLDHYAEHRVINDSTAKELDHALCNIVDGATPLDREMLKIMIGDVIEELEVRL